MKFRIRDAGVRARVLRRGMWNIADIPLIVSKWSPIIEEAQPAITSIPMWVTVANVPHSMFSWKGLGFLTSSVGIPKRLHPETEQCTSFEVAKVFVEADLSKDLPKSFKFQLQEEEEEREVEFFYPWLPPRCSICEKWGHTDEVCLVNNKEKQILKRPAKDPSPKWIIKGSSSALIIKDTSEDKGTGENLAVGTVVYEGNQAQVLPELQILATRNNSEKTSDSNGSSKNENVNDFKLTNNYERKSETREAQKQDDEGKWCEVSPTKIGRHHVQSEEVKEDLAVSPSRFSVLETPELKSDDEENKEEGEISLENYLLTEKEGTPGKEVEKKTRPPLPRATKGINRNQFSSSVSTSKDKASSISNRRGAIKKH